MGAAQSVLLAAETAAAEAKVKLDTTVDEYLEFLELTSSQIDTEIEDLGHEIATVTTQFRVSEELKAVPAAAALVLQEDVEKYANLHKFAARRMFVVLDEAYDAFEDMCWALTSGHEEEDSDEDEINFDDYEESEEGDEGDEEGDDDDEEEEEEESLPDSDDSQDDDYNTAAAEEELAAELDSDEGGEGEGDDGDEDEEDDETDYEDYEEIITDEEVLYSCRVACKHLLEQYATEMETVGLPAALVASRVATLRRMLYKAAEARVSQAVGFFVASYQTAALDDIDNLLCLGMTTGSLSSDDPEDVRAALKNVITVNAVARQALEDLPFTQREAIEAAQADIAQAVHDVVRRVQLLNIAKPRVLEMLMDLDLDDLGDEDDDDDEDEDEEGSQESESQDSESQEESDDDDEPSPARAAAAAGKGRGRAAAKPSPAAAKGKAKALPAPAPSPKGRRGAKGAAAAAASSPAPASAKKPAAAKGKAAAAAAAAAVPAAAAAPAVGTKRKGGAAEPTAQPKAKRGR